MKQYKYQINGNSYAVTIDSSANDGTINVNVNGENYVVVREQEPIIEKKRPVVKAPVVENSGNNDEMQDALRSPLPGTIVEIKVKVGDAVKEGDALVVLEAMKMDNNLTAEKDGVVKSILVQEGLPVKENTPLITFE